MGEERACALLFLSFFSFSPFFALFFEAEGFLCIPTPPLWFLRPEIGTTVTGHRTGMAQQLRKDAVLTAPVCMAAPHKRRSSLFPLFPAASAQHRDPSPASLRKNRHSRAISQPGLFFGECSSAVEHLTIQPLAGVSIPPPHPLF